VEVDSVLPADPEAPSSASLRAEPVPFRRPAKPATAVELPPYRRILFQCSSRAGTALAVWMVLPLLIGTYRITRRELSA
jgi:hypothetical protein